jgi:hypothetical protein
MSQKVLRTPTTLVVPPGGSLPQIHLFKDDGFTNDEADLFGGGTASLGQDISGDWNDAASSVIVVSGTWELRSDDGFQGRRLVLPPGVYPSIEQAGNNPQLAFPPGQGWNDILSSLRPIAV